MAGKVELIPLVCSRCSTPLPARPGEVAWVCSQCKQGLLLQESGEQQTLGLQPLDVYYQGGLPANTSGRPYWVVDANVALERSTFGGNKNSEAKETWSQPRRFFVPAFACTLDQLVEIGPRLLVNPPQLQAGPPGPLEPVVLAPQDIRPYVEFIVMAIEVGRKDKLRDVRLAVSLSQPALWVLA